MPDKTWVLHDPDEKSISQEDTVGFQKNPALAFSLSLLLWGSGQVYNGQRQLGFLFTLFMANFYILLGLVMVYWEFIVSSLKTVPFTYSDIIVACGMFYFIGIAFWIFNALHAYQKATKTRAHPFQGTKNPLLPTFCSFVIPGWGQFLNGQPNKGVFFLIFAMAGLFIVPVLFLIPWIWPTLELTTDRLFLEKVLATALMLSPLVLLMWILSIYDALKVCLDPFKKERLTKRFLYAIKRVRVKGWVWEVIPQVKMTLMLGLFLVFSLTLSHYYFPERHYVALLEHLKMRLSQQEMVLIPHLINRFLQVTSLEERDR